MSSNHAYNVIIVPADHSGTRQYTVTRRLLWTAIFLLVLLAATMGFFVFTYANVLNNARRADELDLENRRLRTQLAGLDDLSQELEDLSALKAQILLMLGVGSPEQVVPTGEVPVLANRGVAALELVGLDHMRAAESIRAFAPNRWPVEGFISKEFYREEGSVEGHPGVDLVAPLGAPVRAAGRGRVVEASYDEHLGNYVVVDHGFGYSSLYGHNERLLVSRGQMVDQGQVIAHLGNTGRSSAPHLHFEVRVDQQSVDPRQYLGPHKR